MGTVRSTGAISVDHLANLRADGDPIICANSEALRRADHGALCGAKRYTHANSDGSADERADAVANGHPDHGPNTLPVSDTLGAPVARTHDRPHAVSFAHSVIGTHRRSHALPVDHVPVRVADTLADNRRTVGAANARANRCPQRSADLRANAIPVRRSVCIADICADDRPHFLPVIHPDAKPNLRTQSEPNRRTNPLSVLGQSFRGPDAFSVHTAPKCQSDAPANDLGTHSDADWRANRRSDAVSFCDPVDTSDLRADSWSHALSVGHSFTGPNSAPYNRAVAAADELPHFDSIKPAFLGSDGAANRRPFRSANALAHG
jgi:hypothetical protein